jgi:two-component system, response regulator YesN
MYKIVIADDENIVRERLLSLLKRLDSDFEVVGSFDNGYDALLGIETLQPDLLITDIKMPYIDGIDLIKQAKFEVPLLQTIIISGYDSFEFAKQAIDLRVVGYLTKPISFEELKEVIYKAKDETEKKLSADQNEINLKKQVLENLILIQEDDLTSLVQLKTISDSFKTKLDNDGINLDFLYQFIVIFDNDQEDEVVSYDKNEYFRVLVSKYFEEEFGNYFKSYNFIIDSQFVALCVANELLDKELVVDKIKTINAKLMKIANLSVSCGISNIMEKGEINYRKMFRHAKRCLEYRTVVGKNLVMAYDDLEKVKSHQAGKVDENEYKAISYEILYGKTNEVKKNIHRIVDEISTQSYKDSYDFILGNIFDAALKSCVDLSQLYNEYMRHTELIKKLYSLKTIDSVKEFFDKLIDEIIHINESSRISGIQSSINQIKQFIDNNYSNSSLSLEDVANELCYSVSYISAIFKKNNSSFTKYLTDIRMEKAKILLADGNNKLLTIATAVGYEDPYYFSHCFKKYYGVSPLEYKNKIQ